MNGDTAVKPRNTGRNVFLTAVLLLLAVTVAGTGYLLFRSQRTPGQPTALRQANVIVSESGFTPAALRVKAGTEVHWHNQGQQPHGVVSGPFPSRTDLPTLNSGAAIGPDGDYSFRFTQTGHFSYYDPRFPDKQATVEVIP
jgi:plastocyanin